MLAHTRAAIRKAFFLENWNIGISYDVLEEIERTGRLSHISWWPSTPRKSGFQADPFFWDGKVLYERLDRWRGRAEIWQANLDGSNAYRFLRTAGHLSYPAVVCIDGYTYLCCEASDTGCCRILRIDGDSLIEIATVNEPIVDPTLLYNGGTYWLFGTLANREPDSKLYIWWAGTITGPWKPHDKNPVKIEQGRVRPAGNFYRSSAGLIRPAQDSRATYGGAVILNRVDLLSVNHYSESPLTRIVPADLKYSRGIHTFNVTDKRILIDGKRLQFHPLAWLFKLRNRLFGIYSG